MLIAGSNVSPALKPFLPIGTMVAQGNPHVPIIVADPAFRVLASRLTFEKLLLAVHYDLVVIATGVDCKLVSAVNEFPHGIPLLN
jgi:hypothetical protein